VSGGFAGDVDCDGVCAGAAAEMLRNNKAQIAQRASRASRAAILFAEGARAPQATPLPELCGEFGGFVGSGKPHQAGRMHVRGDVGDGASPAGRRRGLPGGVGDVIEEKLGGFFVDGENFEKGSAEVEARGFGSGQWNRRHGWASPNG
jgi:hypothetical protein